MNFAYTFFSTAKQEKKHYKCIYDFVSSLIRIVCLRYNCVDVLDMVGEYIQKFKLLTGFLKKKKNIQHNTKKSKIS